MIHDISPAPPHCSSLGALGFFVPLWRPWLFSLEGRCNTWKDLLQKKNHYRKIVIKNHIFGENSGDFISIHNCPALDSILRKTHLFNLPLLCIGDLGEPLALQCVVLLHLGGVAKVQIARPVRVPHGDVLAAVWANVSPPVWVQVFSTLLVHVLLKNRKPGAGGTLENTMLSPRPQLSLCSSYLHAKAGLGTGEGQHFDLHSLAFADNICHVGHTTLPAQLRNVD